MDTRYLRIIVKIGILLVFVAIAGFTLSLTDGRAEGDQPVWRDEFESDSLDPAWFWLIENSQKWSLSDMPGFLRIYSSPFPTAGENPLLREVTESDFMIMTRVLFEPGANFQFAGLVIWQNENNFLQFGRAFCDVPDICVGNGIYFDKILDGNISNSNFATPVDNPGEAYLRLESRGGKIFAYYGEVDTSWRLIGVHTVSDGFTASAVGLTSSQNSSGAAIPADFDYFVLEPPTSPSIYLVNTTDDADDGTCDESHCSLREAINAANAYPATDTIAFSIPGDPPFTIQPQSALPDIADPVTIDGTTQPGFSGSPIIELDGSVAGAVDGLVITTQDSMIRSLVINRFEGNGVLINGPSATGNTVQGNFIGTDVTGRIDLGNLRGVFIVDAGGNLIGGVEPGARNVLSGNSIAGVNITGGTGNLVQGNFIGTDVNGTAPVGSSGLGVVVDGGATDTAIGGTTEGTGNLISGNMENGIQIGDPGTSGNAVQGNYIGTDQTGTAPLPNMSNGIILVNGTHDNLIGGTNPGAGNLISGNAADGVAIFNPETSGNTIEGNYIGTDVTGSNTSGPAGPEPGEFTVTALQEKTCPTYPAGAEFDGFESESDDPLAPWSGTSVHFVGTDGCGSPETLGEASLIYRYQIVFDETTPLTSIAVSGAAFNGPDSILRVLDEDMNVLGVAGTFGGNSFQTHYVTLQGVEGTTFYVDEFDTSTTWRFRQSIIVNGPVPLGNRGNGVLLADGASDNLVAGNLISGNIANGAAIFNPGTTGNTIQDNYIGTDSTGMQSLGNAAPGIAIGDQASDNLIAGNLVSGNRSDGVAVFNPGTSGNTLQGNLIGTDISGSTALPNAGVGIWIGEEASNTQIGGIDEGEGNLISGNDFGGVSLNHLETTGTQVQGNKIGTNWSGDAALPNGGDGVFINASQSLIGGTEPGAGNLISGNMASGISLTEAAADNLVQGNYIGTDVTGSTTSGPAGPEPGDFTVVSLETCSTYELGMYFDGFESESDDPLAPWSGTSVHFVGTGGCGSPEKFGEASLIYRYQIEFNETIPLTSIAVSGAAFNGPDSILRVLDEDMNVLGVAGTFGGNSFQTHYVTLQGVEGTIFYVDEFDTSSTWRFRQSIVVNGPTPLGNLGFGVVLGGGASDNLISGNLISGNRSDGVAIFNPGTQGNTLQGNLIGTDISGSTALPNAGVGIWIGEGASNTQIGGIGEGEGNLISGNAVHGVSINHLETMGTQVLGNYIGTNQNGDAALPNGAGGVFVSASQTSIGGLESGARNLISGNTGEGVMITEAASNNIVQGNYIGTDASGSLSLGNLFSGIFILNGATGNLIGGTEPGAGNVLSGNGYEGVTIIDPDTTGNVVQGNKIGTDVTGKQPIPNMESGGIFLANGASENLIGGTEPGSGNIIAFNYGPGIAAQTEAGSGNSFLSNSIFSNRGLGIDLGEDGVTLNDRYDQDTGPNDLQNYPYITSVTSMVTSMQIHGWLVSTPSTTFRLEFFSNEVCDTTGFGEGEAFLGFDDVMTNLAGFANFNITLPISLPRGTLITATATDPLGSTSEFSRCIGTPPQSTSLWMAAYTYDLPSGYWAEGVYPYRFEFEWSVPESGSFVGQGGELSITNDAPYYDGYVLLRGYAELGREVNAGYPTCEEVQSIPPDQPTRFLIGWLADLGDITYPQARAHFESIIARVVWNDGMSAELVPHEIRPFSFEDLDKWFDYVCTYTIRD